MMSNFLCQPYNMKDGKKRINIKLNNNETIIDYKTAYKLLKDLDISLQIVEGHELKNTINWKQKRYNDY